MFTWLRELIKPALKCERVGHDWQEKSRRGYAKSRGHFRCVADSVRQTRQECKRCKDPHPEKGEWETIDSTCLQGLTMATSQHDMLDETGFVLANN